MMMKSSKQRRISLDDARNPAAYKPRKHSIWQRMKRTVSDSFSSEPTANDHVNCQHNRKQTIFRSSSCDVANEESRIQNEESRNTKDNSCKNNSKPGSSSKRNRRIISTVNNESILHFAVTESNLELLDEILKRDHVDIDAKRPPGIAALHQACTNGNIDSARMLIENGAKVNLKDWRGYSALKIAVCSGNFELAEFLIQNGASVEDIRDGFQQDAFPARSRSRSNIS
eukprot:gene18926-20830_t